MVKPGWQTTEWWTTLLAPIVSALLTALGVHVITADQLVQVLAPLAVALASGIAAHGYATSRATVKAAANAPAPPALPPAPSLPAV